MSLLTLRALGALEVTIQATTVTAFPTDKIRALLIYLALENDLHHRREWLAALFWPEIDQTLALNNLRVTLHRLRETLDKAQPGLGATLIESTRQTIRLQPTLVTTDVARFQALLTACTQHPHTHPHTCTDCRNRLVEAVELYRGELLTGFSLTDAPAFEEWLLLRRETVHQQALAALHRLVQAYEQQGNDEQVQRYASRQLTIDPSREEAHRQLMRSLARRGLRTEALAHFEICRRRLRDQLDVDPDPETIALVEQIRAGQFERKTGDRRHEIRDKRHETREDLPVSLSPVSLSPQDWAEAPEVGKVYGRQHELVQVEQWLVRDGCRVVALLGIGGVGKTTLAAAAVKSVAAHFERVLWHSLLNAPPLDELLGDILQRLADKRLPNFPATLDAQLALLLDSLRGQRILLVLDNLESILNPAHSGQMRTDYEGYAQLLRTVAERSHQSCLLLTSRERPQGLEQWAEDSPSVRLLPLEGLNSVAGQAMLTARGLIGPDADATALVARYSGNPLALKLVTQTVHELFSGDIAAFLAIEAPIFDDIRLVLDQQFARLSPLEQELLLWLAVERIPVTATVLRANLVQPPPMPRFLEALRALQRRSLLETVGQGFTLQNVVIEYLTEQLIERVCSEIAREGETRRGGVEETRGQGDNQTEGTNSSPSPHLPLFLSSLNHHALLKAQAMEYIRQSQARLLLHPVRDRLLTKVDKARLATQIERLLTTLRHHAPLAPGYAGGNLLNLALALGVEMSAYDFSQISLWQAYLRDAYLPRVNLAGADLTGAVFTHSIGIIQGLYFHNERKINSDLVALSFNGAVLGLWRAHTGELIQQLTVDPRTFHAMVLHRSGRLAAHPNRDGTIDLIDVPNDRRLHTLVGDPGMTRLVFSPDGQYMATGYASGRIFVWAVASGHLYAQWQAHATAVTALAFAPDNQCIASGTLNGMIALWQVATATLRYHLAGHTDQVTTLRFTPDGALLVSGSHDRTARLWETASGGERGLLQGHTHFIRHLAIAPNGRWLATGGFDHFIYLWDLQTGKIHQMLADHAASVEQFTSFVEQIAFSPDSELVVAYDVNATISLWSVATGQRLDSYRLHHATMNTLAFRPDGRHLVAGGADCALYLWDVSQPAPAPVIARLAGHGKRISTVAFSPDGERIASGDYGGVIHLWRSPIGATERGANLALRSGRGTVRNVVFSPDGQTLASASDDGLRLWSVATGRQLYLLPGPSPFARVCAFSPDGRWLAGVYLDHTICLWAMDAQVGYPLRHTLRAHTRVVEALLFSPDSRTLFSCGWDNQLCRWDVETGALQTTWSTPTVYMDLVSHPAGQWVAAGGRDHLIRLLDGATGEVCNTWSGHSHTIEALDFTSDGRLLASASHDNSIRLWDVSSGVCLEVLRTPGPYAGMNISGVTGISAAQKAALKALGAVEEDKMTR